jgi:cysteinyl-tRNA synthetase
LGKGALVAKVKDELDKENIKHLFHFCGSGAANNLQAILYHFIIQGGWDKDINKMIKDNKSIWKINNLSPKIKGRFTRFPSQYTDVIELFQALLASTVKSVKKIEINLQESKRKLDEALKIDPKKLNGVFKETINTFFTITEENVDSNITELIDFLSA